MPVNYYPNATELELTTLLEGLQRRQTIGQVYMTSTLGDQTIRSFKGASKVSLEIRRVRWAGHVLYGWDNPYAERVQHVSPNYTA